MEAEPLLYASTSLYTACLDELPGYPLPSFNILTDTYIGSPSILYPGESAKKYD
jgi:hypothetical protein